MKKTVTLCTLFCALFFSLCIAIQAEARTVHRDNQNIYDLDNENIRTSLRLNASHLSGTANELVYMGSYSENYLSRLIWDIDNQYMAGLGFSLQKQWVVLHGDIWYGVTDGDGTMDDYDWLTSDPSWSDWSHHDDTTVSEAIIYDINFEFLIPQLSTKQFILSAFLGYKYDNFSWDAKGGSYIYTETTFRDTTGNFNPGDLGVSYEQTFKTPYIGVGFRSCFHDFEISGRLIGSTLASGSSLDIHHLRNLSIRDRSVDGNMISLDVSASYRFLKHYSIELAYNYTQYDEMKGTATYMEVDENSESLSTTYLNAGGMDLETSMISVNFVYSF